MQEDKETCVALIEAYKEQLEALEGQSAYLQAMVNDYLKAKITIENLEKLKKGEILLPIGGGIYVPAVCEKVEKVLVAEGADVVIEKDLKSAIESIDKRIRDLQETISRIGETYQKIQDRIEELTRKLRELLEKEGKG